MQPEANYYTLPLISQSSLKTFIHSPLDYKYQYVDGGNAQREPTANMSLGSLVHSMILEPQLTDSEFFVLRESERPDQKTGMTSNANKAWKALLVDSCATASKSLVTESMHAQASQMTQACCQHVLAASFLFTAFSVTNEWDVYTEQAIRWQHPESELALKSKLDRILVDPAKGECVVLDYKTTSSGNLKDFGWSVKKFGYDIQAAFYQDAVVSFLEELYPGITFDVRVLFIPQKSTIPYQVLGVVEIDELTLRQARSTYVKALQELEGCLHTGIWEEESKVTILQLSKVINEPSIAEELLLP